jgi:hypothetical protein
MLFALLNLTTMSARYTGKRIQFIVLSFFICGFSFAQYVPEEPKVTYRDIDQALLKIAQLEPKTLDYTVNKDRSDRSIGRQPYGFAPENMREVFPALVSQTTVADRVGKNLYRKRSMLTINDAGLIPVLVASIHELHAEIEKLKAEITELKVNAVANVNRGG